MNPEPLAAEVAVPMARATAMMAKPPAPTGRTPASGGLAGPPSRDLRGLCRR